ncbi:hypothetical protein ABID21_003686 [Pseudorhizobium tarimense]|uniref:Uncharacterized protein n=1 Tax=Pseudorhizobium tarimense TaxID=1079109 RepID=A0ABV2HAJ0_9HYPH|nr:hypothetical protein [Pseudorhizobium tarimense]MCJ8521811.1 hypothetical protein [Pseudorhizobium tarimense]
MAEDERDSSVAERKAAAKAQAEARAQERKARAAEKLRENLLRRKSQTRARRSGEADEAVGLPAAKKDESH